MNNMITKEKNVKILISLLKAHGIRNVVSSPGATNVAFIGSIQNDPFFKVYSSVDERSAAYIACGLAEESGEPVVISCTGATASRNYLPGLTEAYYRKLPILAVTSSQATMRVGHHIAQVIDRSLIQNDIAKLSVELPIVKDADDYWDCEIKINKAILELSRHGGGPVHINLPTTYTLPFEKAELPDCRQITRIDSTSQLPELSGRIAVFIGAHKKWSIEETEVLDQFCATNDAVVFCDHTSGYHGKYRVQFSLVASQDCFDFSVFKPDVLIHIGEVSGDYASLKMFGSEVWRVNPDGEIRDTFRKLKHVFEMQEIDFFRSYIADNEACQNYYDSCQQILQSAKQLVPELPLSNIWLAKNLAHKIPKNSFVHFGILNSLRSWNFFDIDKSVDTTSNVGGFGIDGVLSTLVGSSLVNPEKLYFCILGDLAFFYDMNVTGNRNVQNNVRILIINNGKGTEFRQYNHNAAYFGESADQHIAAAGHYGNKSKTLVKDYAQNLGFEYMTASTKEEVKSVSERFFVEGVTDKPMVFEVFTDSDEESLALETIRNVVVDKGDRMKSTAKKLLGRKGIKAIKKVLRN
ncbi:thiamine pyrophosphate-binding protein [Gayadomonas joobiniege]|uniref:thiamine pyrophosphate-binding protein n=1 Tax=Gayadomonas joobiniege TaxID=1234606 RepID=UPI00037E24DC|nr:thiamine pyrophosphate-binding protein [Gayadomonas joobiniege]